MSERPDMPTMITIGTMIVVGGIAWGVLSNKAEQGIANHVSQEQHLEKHDDQIRALETSDKISNQLNALTNQVVALSVKVDTLTEQLRKKERR